MKYIIGSGWWCGEDRSNAYGSDAIRSQQFSDLWLSSISTFTTADKILIVDSNSPIKPNTLGRESKLEFVSLNINGGYRGAIVGKYVGWTRSVLLGMEYADMCDCEYFVFVEQDCLLYGEGIIEQCISKMKKPYMFGSAKNTNTWHPIQQSFFIIRKSHLNKFINNYKSISYTDAQIEPEMKFCIATSWLLMRLPHWIFFLINRKNIFSKFRGALAYVLATRLGGFDHLPFGYGGYKRGEVFFADDSHCYFQHGSDEELKRYNQAINRVSKITDTEVKDRKRIC